MRVCRPRLPLSMPMLPLLLWAGVAALTVAVQGAITLQEQERGALENIHGFLDVNHDGSISESETSGALHGLLTTSRRTEEDVSNTVSTFHAGDAERSPDEVFDSWKTSPVREWTPQQVAEWFISHVKLPEYTSKVIEGKIDGKDLPLLAVDDNDTMELLDIQDASHRKRIRIKAIDIVLFGPGPAPTSLTTLVSVAVIAASLIAAVMHWMHRHKNQAVEKEMEMLRRKLSKLETDDTKLDDLEDQLKNSEATLASTAQSFQDKEEEYEREHRRLRDELDQAKRENEKLVQQNGSVSKDLVAENAELKAKVAQMRKQLQAVRAFFDHKKEIDEYLRKTYEQETFLFSQKAAAARDASQGAHAELGRLRKGWSVLRSVEKVAKVEAQFKQARLELQEVNDFAKERQHRWKRLQELLSFSLAPH